MASCFFLTLFCFPELIIHIAAKVINKSIQVSVPAGFSRVRIKLSQKEPSAESCRPEQNGTCRQLIGYLNRFLALSNRKPLNVI